VATENEPIAADVAEAQPTADVAETGTVSNGVDAPSAVNARRPEGGWVGAVLGSSPHTVPVKLTFWPNTEGFADELRTVLVAALLTI
jgi:hypothetical protein